MKIEKAKEVKRICELQGIVLKFEVMVLCPDCGVKTMRLRLTDDEAKCIKCHISYDSIDEFLRLMEEEHLEGSRGIEHLMRERRSVN